MDDTIRFTIKDGWLYITGHRDWPDWHSHNINEYRYHYGEYDLSIALPHDLFSAMPEDLQVEDPLPSAMIEHMSHADGFGIMHSCSYHLERNANIVASDVAWTVRRIRHLEKMLG